MKAVSYRNVTLQGGLLTDRCAINRTVTIPAVYRRFSETCRIAAVTKNWPDGADRTVHKFWDSDVAKWMEAAAYVLAKYPDPALQEKVEELIDGFLAHQLPDGYFNSCYNADTRFRDRDNHELYCAGHWMEAAAAYAEATGRDRFLKGVCRYADLIDETFRVRRAAPFLTPGHEEIEAALVRLSHAANEKKYLDLARWFLDQRGANDRDRPVREFYSRRYQQDELPVRAIREAGGHAVRALYLYTGMARVALETGDGALLDASRAVWEDIARRKMYVTGGVGSAREGESFTIPYDLPNGTAYAETCASIALFFFSHAMLLATGEARYADCMETCLYNGILSGVSRSGDAFFYENPLRLDRKEEERYTALAANFPKHPLRRRARVFRCSCCPPNLARLFASLEGYLFTEDEDTVYVHFFENAEMKKDGRSLSLRQDDVYGAAYTLRAAGVRRVAIRIPGWLSEAGGALIAEEAAFTEENGYAVFEDPPEALHLHLKGKRPLMLFADPRVTKDVGKVAFRFGESVYCLEECDNPDVLSLLVDRSSLTADRTAWNDKEKRIELFVDGLHAVKKENAPLYGTDPEWERVRLRLIPYRDFANREDADMTVWIPLGSR